MEAMLLDENENIIESFCDTDLEKVKEWFSERYCDIMSGDGDERYPNRGFMLTFVSGDDVVLEYTKVLDAKSEETVEERRIFRLIWGAGDGPISFFDLSEGEYDFLVKRYVREGNRGDFTDDDLILKYGIRFDPDEVGH